MTAAAALPEIRLRSRIPTIELDEKVGKILAPSDVNVLLVGDCRVLKPDGSVLCVYRRGIVPDALRGEAYPVLTTIRGTTANRGNASGGRRIADPLNPKQSYATQVRSSIVGSIGGAHMEGRLPACRLTAWTGRHTREFAVLYPYFGFLSDRMREAVPERFANQLREVQDTDPSWIIPGSVFSTITVNNTYPTGVHTDKGDLAEGFSVLSTFRRGTYTGGWLTFPEYRVGVDMQDGDLLLMDAHEWHGNTALHLESDDAERISVVCYYRTEIRACGTPQEEAERGALLAGGAFTPEGDRVLGKAALEAAGRRA